MIRRTAASLLACAVLSTSGRGAKRRCRLLRPAGGFGPPIYRQRRWRGSSRPDLSTLGAIDDCNKGNFAAGIAVLERKLRSNGFTLPTR